MRLALFACERALPALEGIDLPITLLPCSGAVRVERIIRALREGADGVLVVGCLKGNCRHRIGDSEARARVAEARELIEGAGMEGDRLAFIGLAPNQGARAKRALDEMMTMIERMGPNPLGDGR